MDDKIKEKMNKLEQEIKVLKNKVEDMEEKEEFTGNIVFREPIKNYYNR
ncbi:hypothetical protein IRP63_09340 [Clostridium botulinum]|nr:hypothetical protein [Clostridium botulinum]AEB75531.1 hypothetical protein CbC4_0851 [Clostridium botulinum BKT015925]MCD3197305.1 hypothetical protein [Clostridium botulinum C/D]MCD3203229.1 hypothetical protein [Clostridium botulinum C/D]MCD3210391.1 hypothetical protein [Clostridium botulinum C/D]MCD3214036.1 hypothetical protein [Clostridium botulinum C/D]